MKSHSRRVLAALALGLAVPAAVALPSAGCSSRGAGVETNTPEAPVLPLAKVRLYESGVAYFERAGELRGQGAALPVPAAHLDDAIKSLVVLSKDGSVEDISFDSRLSPAVARARAGLPPDDDKDLSLRAVLETLRGAAVEVRADGAPIRGRLVDVIEVRPGQLGYRPEPTPARPGKGKSKGNDSDDDSGSDSGAPPSPQLYATIFTEEGEFRRVNALTARSLRPLDADQRRRFESALEAQGTAGYQTATSMTLDASVQGPVRLGYLAEAPIWRTTFRLVFDDTGMAKLQGWALVHNDTDEDWQGVDLELVNGRPDSFLFPLAAPRYERRFLETPPEELSSIPQLLVTTPDAQWGDFADTWGGLSGSGSGYGRGSGAGFGGRGRRVPRVRQAKAKVTGALGSDILDLGDLAEVVGASGEETETVFVYRGRSKLKLRAHRSAMVPFLQESIDATPIVRFSSFTTLARHAIRLVNNTSKTLPPGPVSIFADGGFSGETLLSRLKPGERQFSEIGDDPDTELELMDHQRKDTIKTVVFRNDSLERHFLRRHDYELQLTNRSGREREVHIMIDVGRNATIEGADGIDYDNTAGHPLAIFRAPTGAGKARKMVVVEALKRSEGLTSLDADALTRLAEKESLPARERDVLTRAAAQASKVTAAEYKVSGLKGERATLDEDIERYREHLKSLGEGEKGTKGPLVKRLLAAEDRILKLRDKKAVAERAVETEREALRTLLKDLKPAPK